MKNQYFISVIAKIVIIGSSFLSSVILARYLGPVLKGEYAYILNYVTIFSLILNLGFGQSYTYFKRKYGYEAKQHFVNLYYLQFGVYILITITSIFFIKSNTLIIILVLSIITQFSSQFDFMAMVINVNKKNIISTIYNLIYLIVLLFIFKYTSKNLVIVLIALALKLLLTTLNLIVYNGLKPKRNYLNKKLIIEILQFSFFPMITSLLITFNYNLDIIILERYMKFSDIGIYSIAVALAGMLWILPDAFKDVLFSRTAEKDSIREITFSIKFNLYFCVLIIVGFAIFGNSFIKLFYGNDYVKAYIVSLILFLGAIPMIFFKLINTLYIAKGRQKFAFYILLVSVITNLLLNMFLIPIIGLVGAAIASVITYSICGTIFLISFMKEYGVKFYDIIFINEDEKNKVKKLFSRY